jgi:glycosyltransferase involved in cell wall biosynthesis
MNICLLCYRGNPYCGGQGGYLYFLSRELVRMGHQLTILVGSPKPWPMPWANTVHLENLNLWGVRQNFISAPSPWRLFRPLNFFEFGATRLGFFPEMLIFSIRAFRWLKEHGRALSFHIIHDVQSLGYGVLLMKRFGRPLVTTVHHPLTVDFHTSMERHRKFKERYYTVVFYPLGMQGRVIRRCDRVITSSWQSAKEIQSAFGVSRERVRMVYNGLDAEFFRPADQRTSRNSNEILFVGNTDDTKKGISYLLKALTLLPEEISLTVVDEGRPRKAYAPGLVEKMGLSSRVSFTGKVPAENLRSLYTSAAVVVLPSLYEGFGLPAAEAMACGTPVVATRVGALPEVVGEEGAGILVPPRDPQALAQGILQVLQSDGKRGEMGIAGRRRVENLFTWRKVAERTVEVYKELVTSDR